MDEGDPYTHTHTRVNLKTTNPQSGVLFLLFFLNIFSYHSQATHVVLWAGLHLSRSTQNGLTEGRVREVHDGMLLPRLALVLMLVVLIMRKRRNILSVLLLVVVHRVMMQRWGRVVVLLLRV